MFCIFCVLLEKIMTTWLYRIERNHFRFLQRGNHFQHTTKLRYNRHAKASTGKHGVENIVAKGEICVKLQMHQSVSASLKGFSEFEKGFKVFIVASVVIYHSDCLTTLSYLQTHFDAIAADEFWKHNGQRWNCSWWAISPLSTILLWRFFRFLSLFKVVFRRFVVCGKGLTFDNDDDNLEYQVHILSNHCFIFPITHFLLKWPCSIRPPVNKD